MTWEIEHAGRLAIFQNVNRTGRNKIALNKVVSHDHLPPYHTFDLAQSFSRGGSFFSPSLNRLRFDDKYGPRIPGGATRCAKVYACCNDGDALTVVEAARRSQLFM
ncbi:hypothetical protein ACEPAH_4092 [Sanghuangporus vaninii]